MQQPRQSLNYIMEEPIDASRGGYYSLWRNSASGHVIKHSCIIIHTRGLFYPSSRIPYCIVLHMFLKKKKNQELNQEDKHVKSAMTLCSTYLETFPLKKAAKTHKFLGPTEYFIKCSTTIQCVFFKVKHGKGSSRFIPTESLTWQNS